MYEKCLRRTRDRSFARVVKPDAGMRSPFPIGRLTRSLLHTLRLLGTVVLRPRFHQITNPQADVKFTEDYCNVWEC